MLCINAAKLFRKPIELLMHRADGHNGTHS